MISVLLMLAAGLLLSAFFSGSETGFYRVSRVRLLLDALGGDKIASRLLWLTNNPSLFVATTLVGNNAANYVTSLAIVLLTADFIRGDSVFVEIAVPVLFSPLVFVYGELLPKNLFFHAPNLLLHRAGRLFLLFTALFAPLSGLLWVLGRCLQWLVGESPEHVRETLARKELQQVLQQGQEAGILMPSQRALAQSLFAVAGEPVHKFCTPAGRVAAVRLGTNKSEVLRLARRQKLSALPVMEAQSRQIAGYVLIVDLYFEQHAKLESCRPLIEIKTTESLSAALIKMQSSKETLARVVDELGNTVGFVDDHQLTDPLFRGA